MARRREPRAWGWWTEHKLAILSKYLQAFATASQSVDERIYLDLFAGQPENVSRDTQEEILGSVHRALGVRPPFTRIHLFEMPNKAARLEAQLRAQYPDRAIRVHPGDCNRNLQVAFRELVRYRWAPTFAFVDQQAAEVSWRTLEQISRFRRGKTKAEMWILFGTSFLPRGLQLNQEHMDAKFGDRMTNMFGSEDWFPIVRGRRGGQLTPAETRSELVNLMRWRLQNTLGYRATYPFTMYNTGGQEIYHMIFVSDHPAGDRIMRDLYSQAQAEQPVMREHALLIRRVDRMNKRDQQQGAEALFTFDARDIPKPTSSPRQPVARYQPEPPRPPYQLPTDVTPSS